MTAALIYFLTFAIAATVAACATPLVIRLATHLQIIDATHEDRRVHDVPTPRIGGIAVFFGFAFALFAVLGFALSSPYALYPSIAHLDLHQKVNAIADQFDNVHRLVGLLFGGMLILGSASGTTSCRCAHATSFSRRSSWRWSRCSTDS